MSEFEDKLSSILGDPSAMSQIMALAQSIGGEGAPSQTAQEEPSPPPSSPSSEGAGLPDLGAMLGALDTIDPQLIQSGMQLFSQFSGRDDEKTALLMALKPFLKEERRAKVDRAIQIARMTRLLRAGFQLFKGRGGADV